jgi:hypothetical protein
VYLQMALQPHIVHVVGHSEAHHAATAQDVIEACGLARRAIDNALRGAPDMTADPRVQRRKEQLMAETQITLRAICALREGKNEPAAAADPLTDPSILAQAVTAGILDAPHLRSNPFARGAVTTRILDGACLAVDPTGRPVPEAQRLAAFLSR